MSVSHKDRILPLKTKVTMANLSLGWGGITMYLGLVLLCSFVHNR